MEATWVFGTIFRIFDFDVGLLTRQINELGHGYNAKAYQPGMVRVYEFESEQLILREVVR